MPPIKHSKSTGSRRPFPKSRFSITRAATSGKAAPRFKAKRGNKSSTGQMELPNTHPEDDEPSVDMPKDICPAQSMPTSPSPSATLTSASEGESQAFYGTQYTLDTSVNGEHRQALLDMGAPTTTISESDLPLSYQLIDTGMRSDIVLGGGTRVTPLKYAIVEVIVGTMANILAVAVLAQGRFRLGSDWFDMVQPVLDIRKSILTIGDTTVPLRTNHSWFRDVKVSVVCRNLYANLPVHSSNPPECSFYTHEEVVIPPRGMVTVLMGWDISAPVGHYCTIKESPTLKRCLSVREWYTGTDDKSQLTIVVRNKSSKLVTIKRGTWLIVLALKRCY
ncbi:hypothetical protein H4R33_000348 [Dimargaris cristalligena]|uniref:Peptidase A2 domain-containing protein n=1 Tax=Dimargaris cristalligena TaxID=215637 RepID=A0A4P9ZQQ4_9FUNG|nr:hypothetical protein H4R33_000348 [Dimargaris cristalligena]RKP34750.1 hypothetical protein BJ085DRAFT_36168 [Dimargaris cristalligena]|eukprot:RKP34750.1 hypothetical protein BJ085DRAFT_36168 [Dimargaris cristalligena]